MSAPSEFMAPPQAIEAEQSVLGGLLLDSRGMGPRCRGPD